jgi:hypothetical protein
MTGNANQGLAERIDAFFSAYYVPAAEAMASHVVIVFGRNDAKLADVAVELYEREEDEFFVEDESFVVTGGVGKDSGQLPELGLSEAGYLSALMMQRGIPGGVIYGEFAATNGGENCRNSIAVLRSYDLIPDVGDEDDGEITAVILVAHWASLYRLSRMMATESRKLGFQATFQLVPTPRPEELSDGDIAELIAEFRRLIDWPNKKNDDGTSWLDPVDLPSDLVAQVNALSAA